MADVVKGKGRQGSGRVTTVAQGKPTGEPAASPKRRGRPPAERKRTGTVRVRAYREWVAWLNATADTTGLDAADIIAQGVAAWAAARGLEPPPER